jgi:hypothetical protein
VSSVRFSAFCHISEYGEKAYSYLPQIVLLGKPLTLWAPAPRLVLAHSGLSGKQFLDLVNAGDVRILGREWWLKSKQDRDEHKFRYARWLPEVDDTLALWCTQDAGKPLDQQRVAALGRPDGYEWADEQLEKNRRQVSTWYDRYRRSPRELPSGTLDTIARNVAEAVDKRADERYAVARTILRDARNHGQAFQAAGSDISIHLDRVSVEFIKILNEESGRPTITQAHTGESTPSEAVIAELTRQTTELLRWLHSAAGKDRIDLEQFLRDDAREDLLDWLRNLCNEYRLHSPATLDNVMLTRLDNDLTGGRWANAVARPWRRGNRLDATAGLVNNVTSLLSAAVTGVDIIGGVGIGAMTLTGARTLLRALGFVPTAYAGPNWPFLIALGKPATRRRLARLLKLLRNHPDL